MNKCADIKKKEKTTVSLQELIAVISLCIAGLTALCIYLVKASLISFCLECAEVRFFPRGAHFCYYCEKHQKYHKVNDNGETGGRWCSKCCQRVPTAIVYENKVYEHKCAEFSTEKK